MPLHPSKLGASEQPRSSEPEVDQGRVARQLPSRFTAKVAEEPPVSCTQLSQDAPLDVPDWVITSTVRTHIFRIVTVFILTAMGASWHPTGATLAESWSGTMSCNPAQEL